MSACRHTTALLHPKPFQLVVLLSDDFGTVREILGPKPPLTPDVSTADRIMEAELLLAAHGWRILNPWMGTDPLYTGVVRVVDPGDEVWLNMQWRVKDVREAWAFHHGRTDDPRGFTMPESLMDELHDIAETVGTHVGSFMSMLLPEYFDQLDPGKKDR